MKNMELRKKIEEILNRVADHNWWMDKEAEQHMEEFIDDRYN